MLCCVMICLAQLSFVQLLLFLVLCSRLYFPLEFSCERQRQVAAHFVVVLVLSCRLVFFSSKAFVATVGGLLSNGCRCCCRRGGL